MPKVSECGPGTVVGAKILADFKNWRTTGFKPWGPGVGSKVHYRSNAEYQVVSASAFCSQAKKIAAIALEQMPACDVIWKENEGDDEGFVVDSAKKNPWQRELDAKKLSTNSNLNDSANDGSDEDDDFVVTSDGESIDDLDGFEDVEQEELKSSMRAFLSEYPCGGKLCAVFPLDGNVQDMEANQFDFINDNTVIRRWAKVPKERECAKALIGMGNEQISSFGFSDIDLMLLDAEIKKRKKENESKRDKNGDIWEVRETLALPYKCHGKLYNKRGKELATFRMRQNKLGFAWGYFWLLAWSPPKSKRPRRILGKMVTTKSDSSIFTEKTVE